MVKRIPFLKAHSIGNDFVIIAREHLTAPTEMQLRLLAHRRYGIGCDQVILYQQQGNVVDVQYFNADGSEAESCGNGARALAHMLLSDDLVPDELSFTTKGGLVTARKVDEGMIETTLPMPSFIDTDVSSLPSVPTQQGQPYVVTVGNPHLIYFVESLSAVSVPELGRILEVHPLFPDRINVSFAEIPALGDNTIGLCVWERGAGITEGCGTAACAVAFAADQAKLCGPQVLVCQPGGVIAVDLTVEDKVTQRGYAEVVYAGEIDLDQWPEV